VRGFVDWLCRQHGPDGHRLCDRSVYNAVLPLRACLRHAHGAGLAVGDVGAAIVLPRGRRGRAYEFDERRFLTRQQLAQLLAEIPEQWRPLFELLASTGLRISEALGLNWHDADLATGHLRIRYQLSRNGKRVRLKTAGARRDVVVIDSLARVLRHHRLASPHSRLGDPVFATTSATSLSARNAGRAFAGLVKDADLTDVTPHALRHTYASMLIAQGRDPVYVADRLGHSTPVITLRTYAHLFRAAQQEATAREQLETAYGALLRQP